MDSDIQAVTAEQPAEQQITQPDVVQITAKQRKERMHPVFVAHGYTYIVQHYGRRSKREIYAYLRKKGWTRFMCWKWYRIVDAQHRKNEISKEIVNTIREMSHEQ